MAEITQGDYRIYKGTDSIYLQHLFYNKILAIEKFSCNLSEVNADLLKKVTVYDILKPHAILGIIKIGSIDFLLYSKVCQSVGTIEDAEIYKVKEADLVPICDDIIANNLSSDVKSCVTGIKNLLALGFFYSFHYDLTNSRQKQSKTKSDSIFDSAERKFFWNFNLYKKFQTSEKKIFGKIWMVVLICGYVGTTLQMINNVKVGLYLISRRSVNYAGTRYNTRGVDDDGHVANYLETEQIVKCSNHILSYVQVRGSAPIFFQQTGMTAQTQITRIPEMVSPAFLRHIEEIQKDFQMIFFVNLMNNNKPNERTITQNLENQIKMNNLKSCKYYFFDFQNECKYDNYDKLDTFIKNLDSVFNIFKFYCEDTNSGEVHKEQCGVIRTNCLDCLDRTNVIQTRIAWRMLEIHLNFLNIDTNNIFDSNFISKDGSKVHPIMEVFKDLWADNGDFISVQYAGTASTITTVTKNGKHGFLGLFQHGIVSISRFYQGSFEDSFKQKCFDLLLQKIELNNYGLLGNNYGDTSDYNPILEEELKKYETKFTSNEELFIHIGSWNVGGKEPGSLLFEWLFPLKDLKDKHTPDIYIIGLQEIVDLNAKNIVLSSNSSKVEFWKNLILKHLNDVDKYVILKTTDLVGLFFIVLVKETHKDNIKNIDSLIVRTGLLGTMGNKGSCLLRFNYNDTSFAIANAHLSAGSSNVNARITEINDILNRQFNIKNNLKFRDHDVQFLFGDLNFRIDLDYNTCKQMISSGSIPALTAYDQLNKAKNVSTSLIEMDEGKINFDPTYKYIFGTSEYDSKKKRVPSWCDRILFRKGSPVQVLDYNRVDYTISDHKPIYGLYKVVASKFDHNLRSQILQELRDKNKLAMNSLLTPSEEVPDFASQINDDFFNSNKLTHNAGDGYTQNQNQNNNLGDNLNHDFSNKLNFNNNNNNVNNFNFNNVFDREANNFSKSNGTSPEKKENNYAESRNFENDNDNRAYSNNNLVSSAQKSKDKKKGFMNNFITLFKK